MKSFEASSSHEQGLSFAGVIDVFREPIRRERFKCNLVTVLYQNRQSKSYEAESEDNLQRLQVINDGDGDSTVIFEYYTQNDEQGFYKEVLVARSSTASGKLEMKKSELISLEKTPLDDNVRVVGWEKYIPGVEDSKYTTDWFMKSIRRASDFAVACDPRSLTLIPLTGPSN